eukprot:COSAG01_NODE_54762_length_329_cov_459.447826_1_plen_50_part_10
MVVRSLGHINLYVLHIASKRGWIFDLQCNMGMRKPPMLELHSTKVIFTAT